MIAPHSNAAPGRRKSWDARGCAVGLLLALVICAAPAEAQDLPGPQLVGTADGTELLPRAVLRVTDRKPFAGIFDAKLDVLDSSTQQPAQTHPEPSHTGFKALLFETGSDFKAFPRRRSTWVILAIGGAAAALAHPADDEVNDRLVGSDTVGRLFAPGKWIGAVYAQAGTAIGLYVIGRYVLPHADGEPKTNKVSHLGFDMLRAIVVSQALTQAIKMTVRRDRPTGECCAFPSGHASATFATASVLERHLGYRGAWPTFAIAAYVATSRLHDNRHFLSDVLFGGALGIASGWTIVGRHGRSNYALMPVPVRRGVMVAVTRKPSPQAIR
jgi:membrane-associated phospholipid phosphatase